MSKWIINPSRLQGKLVVPPSKSHTLRALVFALMAKGKSQIHSYLHSPDTLAMIEAIRLLGAQVEAAPDCITVQGAGGKISFAEDVINCGNSGQVLRFIGALAALSPHYTVLTGDASIRYNRPVQPLLDGLTQLGAFAGSTRGDGKAPIIIKGPLTCSSATIDGEDSQPVSGLLIASSFAEHPIKISVNNPGEKPWIDLTLHWLKRFGISCEHSNYTHYQLSGRASISGFSYTVPADFSTAAFPLAAALATQSELTISSLDMEDPQGDKALIPLLEKMGANISYDAKTGILKIHKNSTLKGKRIDINNFIDALPILAVIGCFCKGETEIVNGAIARKKESDRIACMVCELKKMGAEIEERTDGLLVRHSPLQGAQLESYRDHRISMALAIAAMGARGESTINGVEASAKTYPTFADDFRSIGAQIKSV